MPTTMDFNDPQSLNILWAASITEEWNYQIGLLNDLMQFQKDTIESEVQNLEQLKQSTSDSQSLLHIEMRIEELGEYRGKTGRAFLFGFFPGSFSTFEFFLRETCMREHDRRSIDRPEVKKCQGVMDQAKTWLNGLNVGFSAGDRQWYDLTKYREIRNIIVHHDGLMGSDVKQDVVRFAQNKGIVTGTSIPAQIYLTESFCKDAIVAFRDFLLGVHQMIVDASQHGQSASSGST